MSHVMSLNSQQANDGQPLIISADLLTACVCLCWQVVGLYLKTLWQL